MPAITTKEQSEHAAKLFVERHGSGVVLDADREKHGGNGDKIATLFFILGTAAALLLMLAAGCWIAG